MHDPEVYRLANFEVNTGNFYANDLLRHVKEHDFISSPHRHDFYLTVLFTAGTGVHEIDFKKHRIAAGAVFTMYPGQIHSWKLSGDIRGYIFFHTAEFYNVHFNSRRITDFPFFSQWEHAAVIYLKQAVCLSVGVYFARLLEYFRAEDLPLKQATLVALADLIYLDLARNITPTQAALPEGSALYLGKVRELQSLVAMHYKEHKQVEYYADSMNISAKHLDRICKKIIGKTVATVIRERTILEARRLLVHSPKPMKEIASELGFDDPSYFIRYFKKHCHETPYVFSNRYRVER